MTPKDSTELLVWVFDDEHGFDWERFLPGILKTGWEWYQSTPQGEAFRDRSVRFRIAPQISHPEKFKQELARANELPQILLLDMRYIPPAGEKEEEGAGLDLLGAVMEQAANQHIHPPPAAIMFTHYDVQPDHLIRVEAEGAYPLVRKHSVTQLGESKYWTLNTDTDLGRASLSLISAIRRGLTRRSIELAASAGGGFPTSDFLRMWEAKFGYIFKSRDFIENVVAQAELYATTATDEDPILVIGERGTGKTSLCTLLHEFTKWRGEPRRVVGCRIPDGIVESELFGSERGAFTGAFQRRKGVFEEVGAGTIVLDDIDDLPPGFQDKLTQVLEERVFSRLGSSGRHIGFKGHVMATAKPALFDALAEEHFRLDLFDRLNHLPLRLPPLRDYVEDIVPLARTQVASICQALEDQVGGSWPVPEFSSPFCTALRCYRWPGNHRELKALLGRAVRCAKGRRVLEPADLRLPQAGPSMSAEALGFDACQALFAATVAGKALRQADGNVTEAARNLDIDRRRVYDVIRKYAGSIKNVDYDSLDSEAKLALKEEVQALQISNLVDSL